MKRQTRTLLVLVVAVAAAAGASWGVYKTIVSLPVREVEVATRQAVVAANAPPMATLLTKDSVQLAAWPAHSTGVGPREASASITSRQREVKTRPALRIRRAGLPPERVGRGTARLLGNPTAIAAAPEKPAVKRQITVAPIVPVAEPVAKKI